MLNAGARWWVPHSWERKPKGTGVYSIMALRQRDVCNCLVFWPFAHCSAEQEGTIMALWSRYASEQCSCPADAIRTLSLISTFVLLNPIPKFWWLYLFYIGWLRGFIADYGVPLMVLVWTGVSYLPYESVPKGIPRRLFSPNPWSPGAYDNWTVIKVIKHSPKAF